MKNEENIIDNLLRAETMVGDLYKSGHCDVKLEIPITQSIPIDKLKYFGCDLEHLPTESRFAYIKFIKGTPNHIKLYLSQDVCKEFDLTDVQFSEKLSVFYGESV